MRDLIIEKIKMHVISKNGSYQFKNEPGFVSLDIREGEMMLSYINTARTCKTVNLEHVINPTILYIWEYMIKQEIKENLVQ